jgi:hypothetical protein
MNPLQSLPEYERFIYSLQLQHPSIRRSTLVVIRRGRSAARVMGELEIGDYRIVVREKLLLLTSPGKITGYGYEVWRADEKLAWYDSQPHPDDQSLAGTDPHHKHVPPDIKRHRVPAPELSFSAPNLPFLINEIEQMPQR